MSETHKIKSFNSLDNFLKAVMVDRTVDTSVDEVLNESASELVNEAETALPPTAPVDHSSKYKMYRDKAEVIEFKIGVQGVSLAQAQARIILETDSWNLVFPGKVYSDGRCVVPLKMLTVFPVNTVGKITLEVILDSTIFTPWEETFVVDGYKKVDAELVKPSAK